VLNDSQTQILSLSRLLTQSIAWKRLERLFSEMTYYVSSGMFNSTHLPTQTRRLYDNYMQYSDNKHADCDGVWANLVTHVITRQLELGCTSKLITSLASHCHRQPHQGRGVLKRHWSVRAMYSCFSQLA